VEEDAVGNDRLRAAPLVHRVQRPSVRERGIGVGGKRNSAMQNAVAARSQVMECMRAAIIRGCRAGSPAPMA
jgi:hypothetical protein